MANRCNPKCIYFPNYIYDKGSKNYTTDNYGIKHNNTKILCGFDDHIITNWNNCPNYKESFTKITMPNLNFNSNKDKVIILLGKSAAGKDYILNYLKDKYYFNPIVSHTTRPIRTNEINGRDYYFINTQTFSKMLSNDEFVETREYTTCLHNKQDIWYYGISKEEFENKDRKICVVDTIGQKEIIKYYGAENVISIYIDVEDKIRESRAKTRGSFSQSEWNRRLKDDNKKFKKIKYDYIVTNNSSKEDFEHNIELILRKEELIG